MNIGEKIERLRNYRRNLEITAKIMERFKQKPDLNRSINDTIGYLEKNKIKVKYKIK